MISPNSFASHHRCLAKYGLIQVPHTDRQVIIPVNPATVNSAGLFSYFNLDFMPLATNNH